jgi:hypothetical protein
MVQVPTKGSATDAAKTGGINGTATALGETVGRSIIGPGLGTAAGGVLAASAMSGTDRDIMATLAVERGMTELFAGGSSGGSSRGRM